MAEQHLSSPSRDRAADRRLEELRLAKDDYKRLVERSRALVLQLDANAIIVNFNSGAEEITGYSADEVRGRNWDLLLPQNRYPAVWGEHTWLVSEGAPERYENSILTKSGEERIILWENSQLRDRAGDVVGTVSFGIDVTEAVSARDLAEHNSRPLRRSDDQRRAVTIPGLVDDAPRTSAVRARLPA